MWDINPSMDYHRAYELQLTHTDVETEYGTLKFLSLGSRYGYYIVPPTYECGVLFFYHGSRGIALAKALVDTQLLKYASVYRTIIFFGQADGVIEAPHIQPIYNHITYGEIYWGIRSAQNMESDFEYTNNMISYFKSHYHAQNFYYIGHSNGGVFALLLSVFLPNSFTAIVSHKGGLGFDKLFYLDFDRLKESDRRTPILFFTSEHDIHRPVCEQAHELFTNMEFSSELIVAPHDGHVYNHVYEKDMLDWLFSHK